MPQPFKVFGALVATGILGFTVSPTPSASAHHTLNHAQSVQTVAAAKRYTYSPTLISRYTSGCTSKVQARGRTLSQAKQLCQCSINQMQQQQSQGEAITLLIKSQFSSSTDPKTGLPFALTKYFTPCMS
jgi:hypothetical protein